MRDPFTSIRRIRHHDIRDRIARLWFFSLSSIGMPVRAILRRRFSTQVGTFDFPVYLVKCDENLQEGCASLENSIAILKQVRPIWSERMKNLFHSLMIVDSVELAGYYSADRCCLWNPWKIKKLNAGGDVESILLAGNLVFATCYAFLRDGNLGSLGIRYAYWLSVKSQLRFLSACLLLVDFDPTVQAAITVFKDHSKQTRPNRTKSASLRRPLGHSEVS